MKKLSRLFILLLAVMLVAGCSANGYRYVDDGDNSYIVLDFESQSSSSSVTSSGFAPHVHFSSISEMVEDIQNGNFTEEEKKEIAQFQRDKNDNIKIPSLKNLQEPTVASSYSLLEDVVWYGDTYFGILYRDESTGETAYFSFEDEKSYDRQMQIYSKVETTAYKSEPDPTRKNGRMFYCANLSGGREKVILYEITEDSKTMHIREHYPSTTSTVPDLVVINGIENGCYYYVSIEELKERPSLEKLTAFGFRDYVETATG